MNPRYEWDEAKAVANDTKHRVDFADAVAVFDDPFAITIADPDCVGETRFVAMGQDTLGRTLVVVYAESADVIRIISARRATRKERENNAI
jgi:hypothetical protein